MSTLAPHPRKPITIRRRPDLVATAVDRGGPADREWVVKDPLSMRYFRLAEHEYFLFRRLDGRIDADGLCDEFNAAFAPRKITRPRLARFLTMVLQAGLVNVDHTGRGRVLDLRRRRRLRDERRSRWHGIPSFRFRGIDPTRCLDALLPVGRAAFSRGGFLSFLLLAIAAVGIVLANWDQLVREIAHAPARLQSGGAWITVAFAVIAVKVFHELAHGLACRRFGGECRELGLMWILFTPLPYCDVSDAWTFPNKWHRVAVAVAGILAEVFAAAVAILCWRFSTPGLLHDVCLFLGIVALGNTLLVNGNPLMRFDGYFALCDAMDIPNLAERSSRALRRCFDGATGGVRTGLRQNIGYIAYGIGSRCYRVVILVGISLFILRLGRSYEIAWVAWLFVAWLAATSTGLMRTWKPRPIAVMQLPTLRGVLRWGAIAGLLGVVLFVPFRRSIFGSLAVEASMREPAFTAGPGRLREIVVRYGETVAAGDVIAVFENTDLDVKVARLTGELGRQEARLRHINRTRFAEPDAATLIQGAEELCQSLDRRLAILRSEQGRLTLTARAGGTFVPPPAMSPDTDADQLPRWSGLPLDPRNLGASVDSGVLLGEVAGRDPSSGGFWKAVVTLDDGEVARIRVGERAQVWLESRSGSVSGTIESVTPVSESRKPYETAGAAPPSNDRSVTVRYRVSIRLDLDSGLCPGESGEARLDLPSESLFKQASRWLSRTFGPASP